MGDPNHLHRSRTSPHRTFNHQRRFEHWYLDNQVYFITARVRDRLPAFASDEAKAIFWCQFNCCTAEHGFTPWVTSMLDNHYHTLGYLREGAQLPKMMQRLHGSLAELTNDLLEQHPGVPASAGMSAIPPHTRIAPPFWRDSGHQNYFDGCLRDLDQGRRTYRYVLTQCRRHGICCDPRDYPHTRVNVEVERALRRATELRAFLHGVGYRRYGTSAADHAG